MQVIYRALTITFIIVLFLVASWASLQADLGPKKEPCKEYVKSTVKGRIYNCYLGISVPVVVKLTNGKELLWYGSFREFEKYRDVSEVYRRSNWLLKKLYPLQEPYFRADSIIKNSGSPDFYIFIGCDPERRIHLKSSYNCKDFK